MDEALQGALDKIDNATGGVTYETKSLSSISVAKKNETDVDMNNKRLINLATLPGVTIGEIMATPNVGVNV